MLIIIISILLILYFEMTNFLFIMSRDKKHQSGRAAKIDYDVLTRCVYFVQSHKKDTFFCDYALYKSTNLITDVLFFYRHAKALKARWKIMHLTKLAVPLWWFTPRILGAGQNAQNIDFPKSAPYKN